MGPLGWLAALPIHAYRYGLSPLIGPRCRYQPTCSAYALEAIRMHGALKGLGLAMRRLASCHPVRRLGGASGYDPVPEGARWGDIVKIWRKRPRQNADA